MVSVGRKSTRRPYNDAVIFEGRHDELQRTSRVYVKTNATSLRRLERSQIARQHAQT